MKNKGHWAESIETRELLLSVLLGDVLDERELWVLTWRYGLEGERPRTLAEVGEAIGRTPERVRQIQNSALEKVRRKSKERQGR